MDLTRPISTVVPSLDGPVLEVLVHTTRMLSGRQIHSLAGVGSEAGVRNVLGRLTQTGLVHVHDAGNSLLYTLNRNHLAAPAVELLVDLRGAFISALSAEIATWSVPPVHASLFGSTARGDGDSDSDIDLLVIRPKDVGSEESRWEAQTGGLTEKALDLTGNRVQWYELDSDELGAHLAADEPIIDEWRRDGITLFGVAITTLLREVASGDAR